MHRIVLEYGVETVSYMNAMYVMVQVFLNLNVIVQGMYWIVQMNAGEMLF